MPKKRKKITRNSIFSPYRPTSKKTEKIKSIYDNFKPGDLIYGLAGERRKYITHYEKKNYTYFAAHHYNLDNDLIYMVARKKVDADFKKQLKKEQLDYLRLLKENHALLFKAGGKDPFDKKTRQEKKEGIIIRRTCKLLLRTTKERNRHIHFILDGIDHERVCKKALKSKTDLSITSAELRTAYRLREQLTGSITFYRDSIVTLPPWENPKIKQWYIEYQNIIDAKKLGMSQKSLI